MDREMGMVRRAIARDDGISELGVATQDVARDDGIARLLMEMAPNSKIHLPFTFSFCLAPKALLPKFF